MKASRFDGFAEAMFPLGSAANFLQNLGAGSTATIPDVLIGNLYAAGGLWAKIVDLPADDALARGFEVEGDEDEFVIDEFDRLAAWENVTTAIKWMRAYGGGALLLLVNDGASSVSEPLNEDRIQEIEEIIPVDASCITVSQSYSDLSENNYGRPMVYNVRVQSAEGFSNTTFKVHESRLICIPGDRLPQDLARAQTVPWRGRSVIRSVYDDLTRMRDSMNWGAAALERKQQAIHSMSGLGDLLANDADGEGTLAVRKRISLADAQRNMLNGVAIDAEDKYEIKDMNLTGVKDLIQEFKEMVAAVAGFPVTILFGRSASGLHSNGDNDLETYYSLVSKLQNSRLKGILERLITLLYKQKGRKAPSKWRIKFNPLWVPSEKDQAQSRLFNGQGMQAEQEAVSAAVADGALSQQEARNWMASEGHYGLTAEDIDTPPDQGEIDPQVTQVMAPPAVPGEDPIVETP